MKGLGRWLKRYGFYLFLGVVLLCLGGGAAWLRERGESLGAGEEAQSAMAEPQEEPLLDPLDPSQMLALGQEQTVIWREGLACWAGHAGWDIACAEGDAVYALHAGEVVELSADRFLGNLVRVRGEARETVYAGLADECSLRQGQRVGAGALLGKIGSPGLGERGAAHLHLETYKTAATMPAMTSDAQASR